MKKIFENVIWWSGVIMVGLILGISLQFVRAWTEPTVTPPGGNVGAPLNTGLIEQLKQGALGINGLLKLYTGLQIPTGAGAGKVLTSDATGIGTWQPPSGGGGAGSCEVVKSPTRNSVASCPVGKHLTGGGMQTTPAANYNTIAGAYFAFSKPVKTSAVTISGESCNSKTFSPDCEGLDCDGWLSCAMTVGGAYFYAGSFAVCCP